MQKTFNFFFKKLFYRKPLQNSLLQIIHKRSNTFGTLFTHALHLKCTKTFRLRLILLKIYILNYGNYLKCKFNYGVGDLRCVLVRTILSRLSQILCCKIVYSAARQIVW